VVPNRRPQAVAAAIAINSLWRNGFLIPGWPMSCRNAAKAVAFMWKNRTSACGKLERKSQAPSWNLLKLRRNFRSAVNIIGQTLGHRALFSPLKRCGPFQNMVNVVL
jgi:hypothetical protein